MRFLCVLQLDYIRRRKYYRKEAINRYKRAIRKRAISFTIPIWEKKKLLSHEKKYILIAKQKLYKKNYLGLSIALLTLDPSCPD